MEDDKYFYLPKAHQPPADYQIPPLEEFKNDTQHPELNSRDFFYRIQSNYEEPRNFLPMFCHVDYQDDVFLVGTNNFVSASFDGNVVITDNFDSIVNRDLKKVKLVIPEKSNVTALKFIDTNLFVVATMNGDINIWYSKSPYRDETKLASYDRGRLTLAGYQSSIDELKGTHKFLTGSKKGMINVFDFGSVNLELDRSISYGDPITGISAHPLSPKNFATSSIDRSCLIWDLSEYPPATNMLSNYENQLTAVHWTEKFLIVGDEIGNLLTLDPRTPDKILQKIRVSKRGISQISFNGSNRLAIIANSNIASILEVEKDGNLKNVYEHVAPKMIYKMCWDHQDENTFYIVGEKQYAEKIMLA